MVFSKLSVHEKDAFFGLLDEYFQSRPELFGQGGGQRASGLAGTGISTSAAASVVQRALATNTPGPTEVASGTSSKLNNPYTAGLTAPNHADVAQAMTVGRVAAASLAFSQAQAGGPSASASPLANIRLQADGSPSLPRRGIPGLAPAADQAVPGSEVDKLVARKAGVLSAFKKQPAGAGAMAIPSAFVAPKNTFGPPPVRRATSDTSTSANTGAGVGGTGSRVPLRAAVPQEQEREQQEQVVAAEGEWAEVLYDYSSEDPGDLAIEAGTRVWVTTKSSEDWWTGQVEGQGREGLFPASYVKLL